MGVWCPVAHCLEELLECVYGGMSRGGQERRRRAFPGIKDKGYGAPFWKMFDFYLSSPPPPASTALLPAQGNSREAQINGQRIWLHVQGSGHATDPLHDSRWVFWTFWASAFPSVGWRDYNNGNNWLCITWTMHQAPFKVLCIYEFILCFVMTLWCSCISSCMSQMRKQRHRDVGRLAPDHRDG